MDHVSTVRSENAGLSFKEVLKLAKKSYKKVTGSVKTAPVKKTAKKRRAKKSKSHKPKTHKRKSRKHKRKCY